MQRLAQFSLILCLLAAGVSSCNRLTQNGDLPEKPNSLTAVPENDDTLIFASVSGLPPKFIDSGPEKGMGWAEIETQEVRKGLIQDRFNVKQEWMTPARIAHEIRSHHPICTYPVEWNHPELLFLKKPDRLYSIGLNLAEEESRTILINKKDTKLFSKHLDSKGDLNLESLFRDSSLKTVLIRDKDYGFITKRLTEVNEAGEQEVREEYRTHVSLLVVKDNRQLIEMLHADRFHYSFSELDSKELSDSKLDQQEFVRIPYETIRVKDSSDPNLVQISISCAVHPLTLRALPYINRWIKLNRGANLFYLKRSYRSFLEGKEISAKARFGMIMSFSGAFEAGSLDKWFSKQAEFFPGLRQFPAEVKHPEVLASLPLDRPAPRMRWIFAEEAQGQMTLFNEASTAIREEFYANLGVYSPIAHNFSISRLARYYSHPQNELLNESLPFTERKSFPSIGEIPALSHGPPSNLKKLTLFGFGLSPEQVSSLSRWVESATLKEFSLFGGSGAVAEALMPKLPKSIRRINFTASSLTLTSFPNGLKDLPLVAVHLSDSQLTEAQLEKLLEVIPDSIEELSLGFLRRAWTLKTAQAFAKRKFSHLRVLDLENCFLSDSEFQWMMKVLPNSLEELRLGYNFLTAKTLRPLLAMPFPKLHTLDVTGSLLVDSLSGLGRMPMPRGIKTLGAQDCNLTALDLSKLILPDGLEAVNLSNNPIGDDGFRALLPHLSRRLRQLLLSNTRITGRSTELLATSGISSVLDLHLGTNALNDRDIQSLAKGSFQVEQLALPDNRIRNPGAKIIAEKWGSSLRRLSVSSNPISQAGVRDLARHWSSRLEILNLSGLLSLDLEAVAESLPSRLKFINLANNQITNSEVQTLALHLPKTLEFLNVSASAFDSVGAAFLANRLPPALHDLHVAHGLFGGEGVAAFFASMPQSVRKFSFGPANLTEGEAKVVISRMPQGLIWARWVQMQFSSNSNELVQNLPPSLREWFLHSTSLFLTPQRTKELTLPSNLRELSLEGSESDAFTLKTLTKALPPSIEEVSLVGQTSLGVPLDEGLARVDLKNLRTLIVGSHPIPARSLGSVLLTDGGPRMHNYFGPRWEHPEDFRQFTAEHFKNARSIVFSNYALSNSTLIYLVKNMPQNLAVLGLNSSGLTFSGVRRLISVLPKQLQILNISGNNVGQKGLDLFRAYKAKREREDGLFFKLID